MRILSPSERTYAWGSRVAIPSLAGEQTPAPYPIAERWFGAHPTGPALLDGTGLDSAITADPVSMLGEEVAAEFSERLPFMVKLLAADRALSLQAHPSREDAREGFARENDAGLALEAADRNYRDANHKPELIVALTHFRALAGFRPVDRTVELLDVIDAEKLAPYREMLAAQPDSEGLRAVFTSFITLPRAVGATLVDSVVSKLVALFEAGEMPAELAPTAKGILELAEQYPGDSGILGALLLNLVELDPGEGIYMGAGSLHAYLSGMGVEVMANSDNVLRGGLTSKHIDVPELLRILDFEPTPQPVISAAPEVPPAAEPADAVDAMMYPVPVTEFHVSRITTTAPARVSFADEGPQIIICTRGRAGQLGPAAGAWISADAGDGNLELDADTEIFRVRVPVRANDPRRRV
ncbi:mannose-6-phosphate isomerase, class I [Dietzia sp.]|uniref:mannose-6-phosphate isomerase, class I n=1 Tax=Dietzia sp. TaxID=1871616 RepID=UPI002FD88DBF